MKPNAMTKNKDKIETDLKLFRNLINKTNDAIFVADPQTGRFIFVNDQACTSLGYDREELLKMNVMDIETNFPDNFSWQTHADELRHRGSHMVEGIHKRKNGTKFPNEANVSYVVLKTREYMVAVVRDITERKQAEEALRTHEKQLAESQRIAQIGSWEHNLTTGQVFWSDELFRLLGLDPKTDPADIEMFFDMVHPDDKRALKEAIDETVRLHMPFNIEYRVILKNGSTRILLAQAELIHDDTGTQAILSGTGQDITERKQAEEAKDRLLRAISAATEGIAITDDKDRFIYLNDAHARIYGYLQYELIGKTWRDIVTPESLSMIEGYLSETLHSRDIGIWSGESLALRKDGTILPTEVTATSRWDERGNYLGHICIVRDITERRRTEEALSRSEERYRSLFEASTISLWEENFSDLQEHFNARRSSGITDFRAYFADHPEEVYKCVELVKIISVNKATLGLYEAPDEATLLQSLSQVFTAQSFDTFQEILIALAEGTRMYECEAVNQTLTGRKINVLLRWSLLPGTADQGSRVLVSIVDITERKRAEEKLRESEQFIRRILDTVDEGFIVIDRDFRILTVNTAYCRQHGSACEEVIGRHCYEISHKSLRPCYEEGEDCPVRRVFEEGEPCTALHRHTDAKGDILYVETKAFPIKDSSGAVISVIETVNNITEKHLLEEERLKTQKLEAIGTLAGGIAHDFNNLLQGIFGYISMAKMTLDQKERSLAMLEQAEKALHMSVTLTTQLLTFSKGGKPVKKKIPLQPVIENSVRFALSGSRADYRIKLDTDLWHVEADEGQIGQVIQNIVLNADQAMPMGGTIVITAKNLHASKKGGPQLPEEGKYVEISVQDNGIGISDEYLSKIFDPYFTTKAKGSGLGLATCYSIVRNHGGVIHVSSKVGRGTTFYVYLPAVEAVKEALQAPELSPFVRKGRILFMDDEELIRDIAGDMIKALDHEVEFAEHGEEAVEKYKTAMESGNPFDVVILDLTIRGGMGGKETIERLLAVNPKIKAIVSSGYSGDAIVSDYNNYGFSASLTKPYKLQELSDTLNNLLSK